MKALRGCRFGVLGFALAMLLSCSGGDSPTDPSPPADSVVIESISPPQSDPLSAGSQVTFRARVRYGLASADSGRIHIVIQDQLNRSISPTTPQPRVQIIRGTGTVELSDTVTVPASGVTSVQVFFPLVPAGSTNTSVVDTVTYTVR